MAITALQKPTTPNVTNTNLVYTVESDNVNEPQFRYIFDIYNVPVSGPNTFVTRLKTYPNKEGKGIIDISRELGDQLEYDLNWKNVLEDTLPINGYKTYNILYGEQYAPTLDSTSSIYPNLEGDQIEVFQGTVYKNEGSYNFNTSSIVDGTNILSNHPEAVYQPETEDYIWVNDSDYHTITILNEDLDSGVFLYEPDGTFISGYVLSPFSSGSYATLGIGPQNLIDRGIPLATIQQAGRITIGSLGSPNYSIFLPGYEGHPCGDDYTRFAFINEYGTWDYYNVYNPLRKSSNVERNTYDKTFVDYSSNTSNYNISNRGTTQYRTEYSDTYQITTDYLSKPTAQWLTELFKSPEVFIQSGSNFIPIVMTQSSIEWNMNQFRQKLFQYEIEFQYANQPQTR